VRVPVIASVSVLASLLLGVPASATLDNPAHVSRSFQVVTVFGACDAGGSATATPAPAGVGQVDSADWVDCGRLSVAPYSEWLTAEIGGAATTSTVNGPTRSEKVCRAQKWCSMLHSLRLLPPGDYTVNHRIAIDLTQGAGSQTYFTSYPSDCRVSSNDSGNLVCDFTQRVTFLP
jgi:hypothetical protein